MLGVVNHLFGPEFGERYAPLEAGRLFPEPLGGSAVEVLVTDKASYRDAEIGWRVAEARHVARRVQELVAEEKCVPGDVVLLFAAGTSAEAYEEALRAEGLPTHRATGRGYFGQQQVVDLLAYLRLLHNRYDDEALLTVLASPLVGVSNDALVLLRRSAGKRPLYCGLEQELPETPVGARPALASAFRQRYERLASALGGCRARAPVRPYRRRARLRPRGARALGRPATVREPPEARAVGPVLRGAPRPRSRGVRPLRPRSAARRRTGGRGRLRGGGRRSGAVDDDSRG